MSKFQTKVIKKLEDKGYSVIKTIRLNKSGYPDILAMKKGEVDIWIECKEKGDTLKELQKKRIDQLNDLGKIAVCIQDGKGIIYPKEKQVKESVNFVNVTIESSINYD